TQIRPPPVGSREILPVKILSGEIREQRDPEPPQHPGRVLPGRPLRARASAPRPRLRRVGPDHRHEEVRHQVAHLVGPHRRPPPAAAPPPPHPTPPPQHPPPRYTRKPRPSPPPTRSDPDPMMCSTPPPPTAGAPGACTAATKLSGSSPISSDLSGRRHSTS